MQHTIEFNSRTSDHGWLSNFYPAPITDKKGVVWPTSEHAYQAMKFNDPKLRELIRSQPTPAAAKSVARKHKVQTALWDDIRIGVMLLITKTKYEQHEDLRQKLLGTGEDNLVHYAPWGDTFWGVDRSGAGKNWQGKLIMQVRKLLQADLTKKPKEIFVFGSNLKGIHGAGAAKHARDNYGAVIGEGVGRTGDAYAIPTKNAPTRDKRQRKLSDIQLEVSAFITYAKKHPELTFKVTRIGCGLAGYTDAEIAPMFLDSPSNVNFPDEWKEYLNVS